jgi:type I restriction enzyme S subunit
MSVSWPTRTLGELYQIGSSKRVLQSDWKTHGVPFYRGREVTRLSVEGFVDNELFIAEDHFRQLEKSYGVPKTGDILITAIGTIGNTYIVREADRFYFKDASVLWMKRTGEVSSEFVSWWLKSSTFFDQLDHGNGATVDTLTINKLRSVVITVPPLAEQQRIVRLLDEAFEGIATAKANAEKNLQNARALFKSQLQSVFTQSGNGWTDRALEEICSVSAGNSAPQDPGYFTEGTIPFFRTSDAGRIKFGTIYESQDKLNSHGASKLRRYPAGTILFPKSGASTFLNHRVVLGVEGCVSSHLATIVPDLDHVLPQFLLYALTLIDAKDLIQDQSYPSLNLPAIENIRIYLPPLDEQQQVVHLLDELQVITDKLARICSAKQASLEDLKESLLHQAFSGNLEAA